MSRLTKWIEDAEAREFRRDAPWRRRAADEIANEVAPVSVGVDHPADRATTRPTTVEKDTPARR